MRTLFRLLITALLLAAVLLGAAFFLAGRVSGPAISINQPKTSLGAAGTLDISVEAPTGKLSAFTVDLEQDGRATRLLDLARPQELAIKQEAADRVRFTRAFRRADVPDLKTGPARLVVSAARAVLFGLRTVRSTSARDLQIRLTPPRVAVVSLHHFINHAGSEMIVYQATPPDVQSGVKVGDIKYQGFPARAAGVASDDPSLRVAFFALLHDQDLDTPIELYAVDDAGNEATGQFEHRVFPKPFRNSRIELPDEFIARAVPEILGHSPELKETAAASDNKEELLRQFLRINGELRRMNGEKIEAIAQKTAPELLWQGAFKQLSNSMVESMFADHRIYFYHGREVDRQVHLGFDLAVTANVPIHAANRGRVLYADYLGIYGNCVILDHGMGLQTLYAHLSSVDVAGGATVEKDQVIGRSGMTGLAGGDHLHFTTLLNGRPVTPVDWWDPHWIEDRVTRKIREAGSARADSGATPQQTTR